MTKIKHLKVILDNEGEAYTENLLTDTIYVSEKLDGISFNMMKINEEIYFYKRDTSKPISLIDRIVISLYEPPIRLINTLSTEIKSKIPENFLFTFEYFPNTNPINIKYDTTPKNKLVLSSVVNWKENKIFIDIHKWADLFGVSCVKFLNGNYKDPKTTLSAIDTDKAKNIISLIGQNKIQEKIFSMFPKCDGKGLLNDNPGGPVEGFVFLTKNTKYPYLKLITTEYFDQYIAGRDTIISNRKSQDLVNLVIIDFARHYSTMESLDFINKLELSHAAEFSDNQDVAYLEVIFELFNRYMTDNSRMWVGVNFSKPTFANSEFFNLNSSLIGNVITLKILHESENFKDILKILIGYFRKNKTKLSNNDISNNAYDNISNLMAIIQNKIKKPKYVDKIIKIDNKKIEVTPKKEMCYINFIEETENHIKIDIEKTLLVEFLSERYGCDLKLEDISSSIGTSFGDYNIGTSPVNIFPGRFQPFHNGHLKVIKKMYDQNKKPTVLVVVTRDDKEHTYNQELHSKIFKDIISKNDEMIKDIVFTKKGWIKDIVSSIRDKDYEPVLWGYGDDRKDNYSTQIADWADKIQSTVKGYHVDRSDDNISSTDIKKKILNGDDLEKFLPAEVLVHIDSIKKSIK